MTHHNILNNGYFVGAAMHFSEVDRLCIPVPLYHCFGMVLGNLVCITHGATMVSRTKASTSRPCSDHRGGALHGAAWRADHVHRDARASALWGNTTSTTLRTGMMAGGAVSG